jgi:hypothetical protein
MERRIAPLGLLAGERGSTLAPMSIIDAMKNLGVDMSAQKIEAGRTLPAKSLDF